MKYRTKKKLKKIPKLLLIVLAIYLVLKVLFGLIDFDGIVSMVTDKINNKPVSLEEGYDTLKDAYEKFEKDKQIGSIPASAADRLEVPAAIEGHQVVDHGYYALSYCEDWEIPDWVAYTIDIEELNTNVTGRTEDFREDDMILTGSAELSDYRGSGFDRGHLFPSASATSSVEKNSSTFLMSNMVPQDHRFNAGLWLKAEDAERDAGRMYGEVFCTSGPVITSDMKTIGENGVGVPKVCYKVLLVLDSEGIPHTIGMILPQSYKNGNLKPYFKTVNEVEKLTGIDFFPNLDDAYEEQVEDSYDLAIWPKSFR